MRALDAVARVDEEDQLSFRKNRNRHEQRRRLSALLLRLGLIGGALATTAFYAYRVGIELSRKDVAELRTEVERLGGQAQSGQAEVERLRVALEDARKRAEQYRVLADQAPTGEDARELLRLVQSKLGAGLGKDRLANYIAAASVAKRCGEPVVRKFLAKVKGAKVDNAAARFDGITVTASGLPAKDAGGRDEHWYDAAKPVTVVFAEPNGNQTEASGVLPLQHMLVLKNAEYRFTMTTGPRGFVTVSLDRCELAGG